MEPVVNLLRLAPLLLFVLFGLAGCGQVPISTQWKMRGVDPLTFDPAIPRAAITLPGSIRPVPGSVKIRLAHWRKSAPDVKAEEVFTLIESSEPIGVAAEPGEAVTIFRVSPTDFPRIRALQTEFAERQRSEPGIAAAEIKVDARACRTADLPHGPIRADLHIKIEPTGDWLPFLVRLDLRALTKAENKILEAEVHPCPAPAARRKSS